MKMPKWILITTMVALGTIACLSPDAQATVDRLDAMIQQVDERAASVRADGLGSGGEAQKLLLELSRLRQELQEEQAKVKADDYGKTASGIAQVALAALLGGGGVAAAAQKVMPSRSRKRVEELEKKVEELSKDAA